MLRYLNNKLELFSKNNVKLIVVLDGLLPKCKELTLKIREKKRK